MCRDPLKIKMLSSVFVLCWLVGVASLGTHAHGKEAG